MVRSIINVYVLWFASYWIVFRRVRFRQKLSHHFSAVALRCTTRSNVDPAHWRMYIWYHYIYIILYKYIYIYASLCLYIKVCNKPPTWYRNVWAVKLTNRHAQSLFTIKCKWMRHLISLLPNQFSSNVEGGKIKVIHHSDVGIMGLTHSVRHVVNKMLEMHLISFLDIAMKQVGEMCSKMINTWEDTRQYIFIDILICWH